MADVICLGEALIDFVALESGVTVGDASGFLKAPGGAPANVAVGVARLGGTSAFLGKVGDDPLGRFLEHTFAAAGVDTGGMVFDPKYRTGLAFISLQSNGERDFCFFRNPSADQLYAPHELDRGRLATGRIFHFGSITLIDRISRATTLAAIATARAAGMLISYDPNLRPPLWKSLSAAKNGILRAARFADMIKVSEEELAFLSSNPPCLSDGGILEEETEKAAERFLSRFPNIVLLTVTRGDKGCRWWTRRGVGAELPGHPVSAVDTTGAGDGFVAGLLTGLLKRNWDSIEALGALSAGELTSAFREANKVGALTTLTRGAIPALPTARQVEEFSISLEAAPD